MSVAAPPRTEEAASTGALSGPAPGWLRHSVALPALPAMALLIFAHLGFRSRGWVFEWFWAFFNFGFVTVFLAPLCAGLGAWEGARLTATADVLASSGGLRRALRSAWAGVVVWTGSAYLAGIVAVIVIVKAAGNPGGPDLVAISTVGPALAFLAMWVAVGVAAGWKAGSKLAAPLVAVGAFAVILVLYVVNYDLVRVGGATATLLGLAPRPELQLAQIAIYGGVGSAALLLATRLRPAPPGDHLDRIGVVAGVGAALIAAIVVAVPGPDFRARPEPEVCTGTPAICLAGGYRSQAEEIRSTLNPFLRAAADAGLPAPRRFVQDLGRAEEDLVGWIAPDLARGTDSLPYYAVVDAYLADECDIFADDRAEKYYDGLIYFFDRAGRVGEVDTTAVEVLTTGTPDQQAAWIRMAVDYLRQCQ